jgi:hypothetical protein
MSIIVILICLCFLSAIVRVAFGVFKLILAVVFISVMAARLPLRRAGGCGSSLLQQEQLMRWPQEEYEILDKLYPEGGSRAVQKALPHRSKRTINVIAHRRGIETVVGVGAPKKVRDAVAVAAREASGGVIKHAAKALGCTARFVARAADRDRVRREAEFNKRKLIVIAELATLEIVR